MPSPSVPYDVATVDGLSEFWFGNAGLLDGFMQFCRVRDNREQFPATRGTFSEFPLGHKLLKLARITFVGRYLACVVDVAMC